MSLRVVLPNIPPDVVRYSLEVRLLQQLREEPHFELLAAEALKAFDPSAVRRRLMASSLRLTSSMSPELHVLASETARRLGVTQPVEIYQSNGPENAAMHHHREPVLIEIQGRLLSLLDADCLIAVLGHELGHHLAHGPNSDVGRLEFAARVLAADQVLSARSNRLCRTLQVAGELTADRFGLLAAQNLDAILRLEMVATTGLTASDLTWDTRAYLAQCCELMESCLRGDEETLSTTHPEHALRAYAAWLFSETVEYRNWTGQGPGSRTLADVDALLDRILLREGVDTSYSTAEAPPIELHECALAASVLVANADGDFSIDEMERIESVFLPLVEGWREYLDPTFAQQRFDETAPVLAASGPPLLRPMFSLLAHVMGADGVIDAREVREILKIGEVLGARRLFARWMASTLRTLNLEEVLVSIEAPQAPLPPRRSEASDALTALLDGIARRGYANITLRRLVRLMGAQEGDPSVLGQLDSEFTRRKVVCSPALSAAVMDEPLSLTAANAPGEEQTRAPRLDQSRSGLVKGLTRLREQLISGDGRSPSIRMYKTRLDRSFDLHDLEQVSTGLAERVLAQVREVRPAWLVDPSESGAHRGAAACVRALLALERSHRDRQEESGSNDLYLGYPILDGAVAPPNSIVGYAVRAPLILYPVDLERDARGSRGFRVVPRKDESPILNQSLLRLIFNKRRDAFPDTLAEELDALAADGDLAALMSKLREVGLGIEREGEVLRAFEERTELDETDLSLRIREQAVLGLFPQSSSDLLQDYDALLQGLADPAQPLASLLAGAQLLMTDDVLAEPAPPKQEAAGAPLVFADPTQRAVLEYCRNSRGTVIDGPPGTGKSQVIVNLILDAVRRGERVAVVCEKRAALDVVHQRIDGLGLAHAIAVVHDVNDDRKTLYEQVARRLEADERATFDTQRAEVVIAEQRQTLASLDATLSHLRQRVPGTDLTIGQLHAVRSGATPAELDPSAWFGVSQEHLKVFLEILPKLLPFRDVWGPHSRYRPPAGKRRKSFAGLDEGAIASLQAQLGTATRAARDCESSLRTLGITGGALERIAPLLEREVALRHERKAPEYVELFRAVAGASPLQEASDAVEDALVAARGAEPALTRTVQRVSMPAPPELLVAMSIAERWSSSLLRFFVIGWWTARGTIMRSLRAAWPERAGAVINDSFLEEFKARIEASRAWQATETAFSLLRAPRLQPHTAAALLPTLELVGSWAAHLLQLQAARAELAAAGLDLNDTGAPAWDTAIDVRRAALSALTGLRHALEPLLPFFPSLADDGSFASLEELERSFARDATRVAQADALMARATAAVGPTEQVLDTLVLAPVATIEAWQQAVLHAWATANLQRAEQVNPELARLGTPESDLNALTLAGRLKELESARARVEKERVAALLDQTPFLTIAPPEKHKRRTGEQATREDILKEARKKRNVMALRTFVRKFSDKGLLDVMPVWLLSPETMTILFPREPLFDLVIFDEASQCTVEAGFPVLLRAKRIVVAGDERQMPPTSFFKLGSGGSDDDAPGPEAAPELARDIVAAESLLTLARTRLRHVGLKWHYRCHDESLIAFSNHSMYEGSLRTIPSTLGPSGPSQLRWIDVPDGQYQDGVNEPEANRVVELLSDLLSEAEPPTVGVVTFNLKQRRAILDAIDRRAADDSHFDAVWKRASGRERVDEKPFVKNLESVQGDERDVIVFSLGHAPTLRKRKDGSEQRVVPARFGPLGQRGGERRLNVAISRAKKACYVVSSFDPALLSVANSQNTGPRLFREYLEFSHATSHGRHEGARRVLDRVRGTRRAAVNTDAVSFPGYQPVATQLALALEKRGIKFDLNVGSSDFRVQLAIVDPNDPHAYRVGVLVDEGDEQIGAFEAFVHRPGVLTTRGWRVLQLNAATWSRNPTAVVNEIEAMLG